MNKEPVIEENNSEFKHPKKKDYLEIRIPRITFHNTSANIYLVYTVVIFAFLLGMLTNKVLFLEKQMKTTTTAVAAGSNQAPAVTLSPTPIKQQIVDSGKLPVMGNTNAKVSIVEFSDFQCPFCEHFYTQSEQQLIDTYIKTGKVKFAYRHYPLYSIHPNSEKASEASECANEQGKFWDFHDLLFKNQTTWSPQSAADAADSFTDYAGQLSLDTTQFRSCLDTDKYKQNVTDDANAGTLVQVDGTPTFFINGWPVVGAVPFATLQQTIERELKK